MLPEGLHPLADDALLRLLRDPEALAEMQYEVFATTDPTSYWHQRLRLSAADAAPGPPPELGQALEVVRYLEEGEGEEGSLTEFVLLDPAEEPAGGRRQRLGANLTAATRRSGPRVRVSASSCVGPDY